MSKTENLPNKIMEIDRVVKGGEVIMLDDLCCDGCDTPGSRYLALTIHGEAWAFCSEACRMDALTIAGKTLTKKGMEDAGLYFVSPPPQA